MPPCTRPNTPRHLAKANKKEQFDQVPVGTGPFSFVTYQKDAVIRYKAFKAYWGRREGAGGRPGLRHHRRRHRALPASSRPANATSPATRALPTCPRCRKTRTLKVTNLPGLNIAYWSFNTQKAPFDKKEVRQAFTMAIDKAAILKDVYLGAGTAAKNLIPPTLWGYNDKVAEWPHDPAKAKALLEKAGVKTPLDVDLWYMPVQRPYNPNAKRMAEMMQADLAKIGVNAKLVTYEWGEYRKRMQQGEHLTGMLGWNGDNGDPDNFFFLHSCDAARPGGQNLSKWCHKGFDEKLEKARSLTDNKARAKLYEEMQVIEREEAPDFKIAHSVVYEVMRKEVTGYKQSPFNSHEFKGVDLK